MVKQTRNTWYGNRQEKKPIKKRKIEEKAEQSEEETEEEIKSQDSDEDTMDIDEEDVNELMHTLDVANDNLTKENKELKDELVKLHKQVELLKKRLIEEKLDLIDLTKEPKTPTIINSYQDFEEVEE